MTKYYCDKCGKEINDLGMYVIRIEPPKVRTSSDMLFPSEYQLCRKCGIDVDEYINARQTERSEGMLNRYDIDKCLDDFVKAKKMLNEENCDKEFLKGRMNDGIYLTTLVEFLMTLEEPDGVLEKARIRQSGKE